MTNWATNNLRLLGPESYEHFLKFQSNPDKLSNDVELRSALLDFIADFSNWDNSTVSEYLETSRALTQSAHEGLGGASSTKPLVVDPFAGGGSIPLEALRVGADAFASDLNPVPVLLNKVVLEYIPKYGQRLAEEVRKWGEQIKREAEEELSKFYPKGPDGAAPIAYLWARTIQCEGPACGAEVPLIRSLWLANKGRRCVALQLLPNPSSKRVDFQIITKQSDGWVNQADTKIKLGTPKFDGTVKRGSATCPCCGYTTPVPRVREQLKSRRGGANDARLLCIVSLRPGETGRHYRLPNEPDFNAIKAAAIELERRKSSHSGSLSLVPDEPTPTGGGKGAGRAFSQRNYGMDTFADLFTARQLLSLTTFSRLISSLAGNQTAETDSLDKAVQTCLALNFDRVADLCNSLCGWKLDVQCPTHLFARQAISMVWDFSESVPLSESSGSWHVMTDRFADILEAIGSDWGVSSPERASATSNPLPDDSSDAFITDPPYYDAVPYSDLSDFFFVWLRRNVLGFGEGYTVTPKEEECIVDDAKGKDSAYFEDAMRKAMNEGRRILTPRGIGVVVFAHKTTAGWEALLQAMVDAGWIVTGSWPIDTEMDTRLRARDSAALASSVHLVCRPREHAGMAQADETGDWRDVLQELPRRIHDWMPRLAEEGVVGADAIFACLGPALEIFSRYSKVEKASGQTVTLREYLEQVWGAVAKEALDMVFQGADASGFEEDARLTAMWLWTLFAGETGNGEPSVDATSEDEGSEEAGGAQLGYVLEYDTARKIAQGLGVHLESLTSLVEIKGDVARLLPVAERTRRLFGKDESEAPTSTRKKKTAQLQLGFVAELEHAEEAGSWGSKGAPTQGDTVLDRVHQCLILFAAGRGEALRRFLVDEGVGRDQRFWRLAQVLSYLYPKASEEKRWIDGVLARKKGLGF